MNGDTMDKDNDVVIVDSTSNDFVANLSDYEDKPLMMLFKRLIGNDNKENTVLTNAQILNILQKEFHMDILYIHELEIDIYLNILKKYLKDWPQWDEFDSEINVLKRQKNHSKITTMLESNYESLKAYLKKTLTTVEPLLKKTIEEVKKATVKEDDVMEDDIVMQLQCTREQLNCLFFRRPHPSFNNTIFNVEDVPPKIRISKFTLDSMLNWPDIRISINLNSAVVYRRDVILTLKHVLVNKMLNYVEKPPENLSPYFQCSKGGKLSSMELSSFLSTIDDVRRTTYKNKESQQVVQAICDIIKSDLVGAPPVILCPLVYRRFLSKNPYVRHLYTNVESDASFNVSNYDLQLQETGIPQVHMVFSRYQKVRDIPSDGSFLRIDCMFCDVRFSGPGLLEKLKAHFEECHNAEQSWQCTRCKVTFSMEFLARMKWGHICEVNADKV